MTTINLEVILGNYKAVELSLDDAKRVIEKIVSEKGYTQDLRETLRILSHFDTFYEIQVRKCKDALVPTKDEKDLISGKTIIDKVKLIERNGEKLVRIIFDRRVGIDFITDILSQLGYEVNIIDKR